jgi:hypothetical protein
MCTRARIKHVYQGVQGACPQQAVTSAGGMAERQRAPCHRHGSKACLAGDTWMHISKQIKNLIHFYINQCRRGLNI